MDKLLDILSELGWGGNEYVEDLWEIAGKYAIVSAVIGILVGLLNCFLGYKIKKIWTALIGLLVFAEIAFVVTSILGSDKGVIIGVTIGAGIIGALLGFFLWRLGCSLRALVIAAVGAYIICFSMIDLDTDISLIVALAVGLIVAILVFAYIRPLLIIYTSVLGGFGIASSVMRLLSESTREDIWFLEYIIAAVFAIAGIIVQFLTTKKKLQEETVLVGETEQNATAFAQNPDESAFAAATSQDTSAFAPSMTETVNETVEIKEEEFANVNSFEPAQTESFGSKAFEGASNEFGETVTTGEETVKADAVAETETITEETKLFSEETAATTVEATPAFCPDCGEPHKEGAKFCMKCGRKLI